MRLEEYWGVGPKTRERLESELGVERGIEAIESGDVGALVSAGLSRGRATRILRRANGGEGMSVLSTRDTRAVYKELLDVASDYAVTETAADRIRVLTPLLSEDPARRRLDSVMAAVESWRALPDGSRVDGDLRSGGSLDGPTRGDVLAAFSDHGGDDEENAVRTALALQDAGLSDGAFARIDDVDREALENAAAALADLDGDGVAEGVDDRLDALRTGLEDAEALSAGSLDAVAELREAARGGTEFGEAVVDFVASETGVDYGRVRAATPDEAADATDYVSATLRALTVDLREAAADREQSVAGRLRDRIADNRAAIDAAVEAVSDLAFYLSLARFAVDFDLARPAYVDDGLAVRNARNVGLVAAGDDVQPITYAVGDHGLSGADSPPHGDRVSVLTGANSGGKTTLVETLCQVALLAQMGLPVPADRAEVSLSEDVVFHRRHASFNAGVLESTLRSIVPPLSDDSDTLMLVDEFEAITEPGRAADLLHGLVRLTVDRAALGVFVTHLAEDLRPLPDAARTDGIFAEGLDDDLELRVDYQPRFETVGKSTPEFIVSRLLAGAGGRAERSGFETLARAVGEEAVQRTLEDWSPGTSADD